MSKSIRIGTRGSDLALWQANKVRDLLQEKGHGSELIIIQSTGDKDRKAKLHELGLVGVFTKELDDALLLGEIDIAVHSLKDVPTSPPKGIIQLAVLERANPFDLLVSTGKRTDGKKFSLATGSLRRRAFWQNKFPLHTLENLRGNVPTRLQKVLDKEVDGVILAKAGLDRLNLKPKNTEVLEWMTPAPAQGIVGVFGLKKNKKLIESLSEINHQPTEICAKVERDVLKTLEGGCTAPIGAYAEIVKRSVQVKASLLSEDGIVHIYQEIKKGIAKHETLGEEVAKKMLSAGGKEIMDSLKSQTKNEVISKTEEKEEKTETTKSSKLSERVSPVKSASSKVLCLKKLTPPRIKAGIKFDLDLNPVEVIQTLPDYDAFKVSKALKSTNNWVFTSLNSVSAITKVLKGTSMIHKHVYCVGSRVANFFDGKVKAIHQMNSVSELKDLAIQSGETNFTWFHGNLSDLSLIEEFNEHEIYLSNTEVYRTVLTEPRIESLESYGSYMFFSPSGVESFKKHNYIPENASVAAIGSTTASAISELFNEQENTKPENIISPDSYGFETLLAALGAHNKTNGKD